MNENDIKRLIETAVTAAYEAGVRGTDEKIQAAINLALPIGIQIGAEVGSKIGAEKGAAAAVRAAERERKKVKDAQRDNCYHNTKLLLRHYRTLNEHYKKAVFDVQTAEESSEDFAEIMQAMNSTMSDEDLFIESIKQSCVRTKVIMAHVNKMLDIYGVMCERSSRAEDKRHWRILSRLYLDGDGTTAGALAEAEHINKRTVYKDVEACIADLTTLLFGVGGIDFK